jgi:acid phosphatase type 7
MHFGPDEQLATFTFLLNSHEEDYPTIRKQWGDLFDKYHVDMVMSGHVHYYMRSKPMYNQKPVASPSDGTIYLISIGVPNRAGNFPPSPWVDVRFGGEMLYQTFDIDDDKLVIRARNIDGEIRDELVIEK